MLKVRNKYNYPILAILLLWICFAIYYWFYINPDNCGSMIVYMGLILITVLLLPISFLIIVITNKICKLKYDTDTDFITIPCLILGLLLLIYFLFLVFS